MKVENLTVDCMVVEQVSVKVTSVCEDIWFSVNFVAGCLHGLVCCLQLPMHADMR